MSKRTIIIYPLRMAVLAAFIILLICMFGCAVKPSNAQDPIKAEEPGSKDEPNHEYGRWSTVKYDGHLYTVRDAYNSEGSSMVHAPSCPCLTNKIVEAR